MAGTHVQFETLDADVQTLLRKAVEYREFSYSKYSNFKVGACLETDDGKLYGGCNVENASFTVGSCAERIAYFKAISDGQRSFKRLALVAFQKDQITTPCGACRQFINEFNDLEIYAAKPELKVVFVTTGKKLLPADFQLN